jgi:hypothetical protein
MRCLSRCADTSTIFKQKLTLPVYCVRISRYGRKTLASGWNANGWRRNCEPNRNDLSKGRAKSKTIERDFHSAVHSINSSGLA